jgi:hypothetical protein
MILVRDIFRLKYGQARPALALFKEANELMTKSGNKTPTRDDRSDGPPHARAEGTTAIRPGGQRPSCRETTTAGGYKFTPLVESGSREIHDRRVARRASQYTHPDRAGRDGIVFHILIQYARERCAPDRVR